MYDNMFDYCQKDYSNYYLQNNSSGLIYLPIINSETQLLNFLTPVIKNAWMNCISSENLLNDDLIKQGFEKYKPQFSQLWKNDIRSLGMIIKNDIPWLKKIIFHKMIFLIDQDKAIEILERHTLIKNLQLYRFNEKNNITICRKKTTFEGNKTIISYSEFHTDEAICILLSHDNYNDKLTEKIQYTTLKSDNVVVDENQIFSLLSIKKQNLMCNRQSLCVPRIELFFNEPLKQIITNQDIYTNFI